MGQTELVYIAGGYVYGYEELNQQWIQDEQQIFKNYVPVI